VTLRDLVLPGRVLLLTLGIAMLGRAAAVTGGRREIGPEVIYARAQKAIKNSNYNEAVKQLETLQSRFPSANRPPGAAGPHLRLLQEPPDRSAIDAADTFIRENPTNLRVDYAYYMKGLVYFERQANTLERFFNVDLSKRPPSTRASPSKPSTSSSRNTLTARTSGTPVSAWFFCATAWPTSNCTSRSTTCAGAPTWAPQPRQILRGELRRRAGRPGFVEVMVDAYRALNMNDLAATPRGSTTPTIHERRDVEARKSWWRRIL